MASYSVAEAKNNLSKLLDRVLAGEEVAITRRGQAIVRIVPELPAGKPFDLDWIRRRRIVPESGTDFDSVALVRGMRDEGY